MNHLVKVWGVAHRSLSGRAARAQDYLCQQAEKYRRFAAEIEASLAKRPRTRFTWLPGCEV
jgi:acyl-[acyl-carrier-protein] desaturase